MPRDGVNALRARVFHADLRVLDSPVWLHTLAHSRARTRPRIKTRIDTRSAYTASSRNLYDFSDLQLRKRFLTPLIEDFKTYGKALEKDGSKSDRAKLLALASVDESADGDGETERGTEVIH